MNEKNRLEFYGELKQCLGLKAQQLRDVLCRKFPEQRSLNVYEYRVKDEFLGNIGCRELHVMAKSSELAEKVIMKIIGANIKKIR
jgi:hypothetical protein